MQKFRVVEIEPSEDRSFETLIEIETSRAAFRYERIVNLRATNIGPRFLFAPTFFFLLCQNPHSITIDFDLPYINYRRDARHLASRCNPDSSPIPL